MKKTLLGFLVAIATSLPIFAQSQEPFLIPEYDSLFSEISSRLEMNADASGIFTSTAFYVLPSKKIEGNISVQKAGELIFVTFFCSANGLSYGAQCGVDGVTFFKNNLFIVDVAGDENNYTTYWRGEPAEWRELPEDLPPDELIYMALNIFPSGPNR